MACMMNSLCLRRDGSAAVEFAIIAPIFIAIVLSLVGYAIYFSTASSVQQLSEDAVRAAVAGLTPDERESLAEGAVNSAVRGRVFIDPTRIQVNVSNSASDPNEFAVNVSYDASHLPIWSLLSYAMPVSKTISRTTVMRMGGV